MMCKRKHMIHAQERDYIDKVAIEAMKILLVDYQKHTPIKDVEGNNIPPNRILADKAYIMARYMNDARKRFNP